MLWRSCCDCVERSLSTTCTRMFFTSMFITHGMTHIIMTGKNSMSLGRNELRRICRNSFCIRNLSVISGYSKRVLNFFRATVSSTTVMPSRMPTSRITSPMPTPIIISLRMASM